MGIVKKATFATLLAATAMTAATPAMARHYEDRRSDNTAGAAIVGGVIGLALGAIIASSGNDRDNYRGDYRYRYQDRGWTWRDGYYWDREGRRYYRDGRLDNRYRGHNDRSYYSNRQSYDRYDNYYGRRGY